MQTVLITGATSGFGKACAELFAQHQWRLILTGRRTERLEALKAELETHVPVHIVTLDVRDNAAVKHMVASLPDEFSAIDLLINNAGLALGLNPAYETSIEDWDQMVDTNIKGLMYCTRAILPSMVKRNKGHIINIGSIAGRYPYPGGNVYGSTKAFVYQFSHNLRSDLSGTAIRVSNVEPGLAETEFSLVRFGGEQHKADNVYTDMKPLTAGDIADTIYWIATTPQHVNVNSIEVMPVAQSWGMPLVARGDIFKAKQPSS